MVTKRRAFIRTGLGLGWLGGAAGFAQAPRSGGAGSAQRRKLKTTVLFKSPGLYPNGLAVAPEGLWIAQQKISVAQAAQWNQPVPKDRDEAAWLVDWNGKLLKTVVTQSRNTSGLAYGDGCVWMGANTDPWGLFQVDGNSKQISHRQIPLGPANNGGGCHGAQWRQGKLWIYATRLGGLLRVDPKTWQPEFMVPIYRSPEISRYHDLTFDGDGAIWQMVGRNTTSFAENWQALVKYDAATGRMLEIAEFLPGSADVHNLEYHDGALIGCDAGLHPDWKDGNSPFSGAIFRIDFV